MRLLSIETATDLAGVALLDGTDVSERIVEQPRQHNELVPALVTQLLGSAGIAAGDLDAIVVDVGPGLFTGLRVGIALAKGLALGAGVGMLAVRSTEVLAEGAREHALGPLVHTVLDARRKELYVASFELAATGTRRVLDERVCTPESAADIVAATPAPIVGDGLDRLRTALDERLADRCVEGFEMPRPRHALELARRAIEQGAEVLSAFDLHPLYLRDPDARANFKVRER